MMLSKFHANVITIVCLGSILHLGLIGNAIATTTSATTTDGSCDAMRTKLRLELEWFINPDHLPFVVAERHGIFWEFGLDVKLIAPPPPDHWEANEQIQAGNLDLAVMEPLHLAQDAARGEPLFGFLRILHTDGGVMYDKAAGIKQPRDMCGKTISYPGSPGPGGPAIVNTIVRADGGECDIDSYGKYNGGFFHTDALESGKAKLATLIFWNFKIPEALSRGMNVLFFLLKEYGVPDFCQLILMTTPTLYQKLKPALQKLAKALRRAMGLIHQSLSLARRYYEEYTNAAASSPNDMLDSIFRAMLPAFLNDYTMSLEYYENLMAWLIQTGQVEE